MIVNIVFHKGDCALRTLETLDVHPIAIRAEPAYCPQDQKLGLWEVIERFDPRNIREKSKRESQQTRDLIGQEFLIVVDL